MSGLQCQCPAEGGTGFGILLAGGLGNAFEHQRLGLVRQALLQAVRYGDGLVEAPGAQQADAQAELQAVLVRIEFDGFLQLLQPAVLVAGGEQAHAVGIAAEGGRRCQFGGTRQQFAAARGIALGERDAAEQIEQCGIIGLAFEQRLDERGSGVGIPAAQIGIPEQAGGHLGFGMLGQEARQAVDRRVELSERQLRGGQVVAGIGVVRRPLQRTAEGSGRLGVAPLPVGHQPEAVMDQRVVGRPAGDAVQIGGGTVIVLQLHPHQSAAQHDAEMTLPGVDGSGVGRIGCRQMPGGNLEIAELRPGIVGKLRTQ